MRVGNYNISLGMMIWAVVGLQNNKVCSAETWNQTLEPDFQRIIYQTVEAFKLDKKNLNPIYPALCGAAIQLTRIINHNTPWVVSTDLWHNSHTNITPHRRFYRAPWSPSHHRIDDWYVAPHWSAIVLSRGWVGRCHRHRPRKRRHRKLRRARICDGDWVREL